MKNTVKTTIPAFDVDMGGLLVKQALPANGADQIDPFLLLHHTQVPVKEGAAALGAGVPPHPHRGFSAVTFVIGGEVHHRDSLGNSSVIGAGGVQWVNAGRGIVHSERPSAPLAASGGNMDVIQLWVNTPSGKKLEPAAYYALDRDALPKIALGENAELHLVAGKYGDQLGKIPTHSEMTLGRVYSKSGAQFSLDLNPEHNVALYVLSGDGSMEGHGMLEAEHLYHLSTGVESILLKSDNELDFLLLSGKAINEPLATYGPFVMNTQTQIMEALRDYQAGKMGVLIEE